MNKFNLDKVAQRFKGIDLSLDMANVAKNEFLDNFKAQGFNGNKWQEVQRRKSKKGPFQAILQGKGSGRLRKDVANSVSRGRKNSRLSYTLIVENPYAAVHNEGLQSGRGKGFKMPKRQFVGTTSALRKKIGIKIQQKLRPIWAP